MIKVKYFDIDFKEKTKTLIDNLKSISANYGLGNDGNEFKIITQVFLYKFMNDKFAFEVKKLDSKLKDAENWENISENSKRIIRLKSAYINTIDAVISFLRTS